MALNDEMTLERLTRLLDALGARPERWPDGERDAAAALLARSATARAHRDAAAALDRLLDEAPAVAPSTALAARVLGAAPRASVVVPMRGRRRTALVAALGLAAAASLAVWLVRRADAPRDLDPATMAQLDDYETPIDALLAASDADSDD